MKRLPGPIPSGTVRLTEFRAGDVEPLNEKKITGGLCWVRAHQLENEGAYQINPDRGHIAKDFESDDWQLPIYKCKLCGCLFGIDTGNANDDATEAPTAQTGDDE
jgi:hypothetical protein